MDTQQIIADLVVTADHTFNDTLDTLCRDAADRLAELDAKADKLEAACDQYEAALRRRDALRPPCPTCGGTTWVDVTPYSETACPDCVDGKMPFERMARTVNHLFHDAAEMGGQNFSTRDNATEMVHRPWSAHRPKKGRPIEW